MHSLETMRKLEKQLREDRERAGQPVDFKDADAGTPDHKKEEKPKH